MQTKELLEALETFSQAGISYKDIFINERGEGMHVEQFKAVMELFTKIDEVRSTNLCDNIDVVYYGGDDSRYDIELAFSLGGATYSNSITIDCEEEFDCAEGVIERINLIAEKAEKVLQE
jgi:hypothetical protein